MYHYHNGFNKNKISSEFACRLRDLSPQQKVNVLVFLEVGEGEKAMRNSRQTHAERKAARELIRNSASKALNYVQNIIHDFGGKQLAENPNALGCIPVEISAAGVNALAASDAVKVVMEEQKIHPENGTNSYFIDGDE
jgi:hypothetical protein